METNPLLPYHYENTILFCTLWHKRNLLNI